jgi:hypothetical protein
MQILNIYLEVTPTVINYNKSLEAIMLKRVLSEYLSIERVMTVALIGSDGFVIEIADYGKTDLLALGALCSCAVKYFQNTWKDLRMGSPQQIVMEYEDGVLLLIPLTSEEFIAVITDSADHLGQLKYSIERSNARISALI